jgi:hypothetical protein
LEWSEYVALPGCWLHERWAYEPYPFGRIPDAFIDLARCIVIQRCPRSLIYKLEAAKLHYLAGIGLTDRVIGSWRCNSGQAQ